MDAVRMIRRELDGAVPLIGFSGSPWTLACYMVEGGGSKEWGKVKALALNEPAAMHQLLNITTDAVIAYLSAQRDAGAQALQVFDLSLIHIFLPARGAAHFRTRSGADWPHAVERWPVRGCAHPATGNRRPVGHPGVAR